MKKLLVTLVVLAASVCAAQAQQTIVSYTTDGVTTFDTTELPGEVLDTTDGLVIACGEGALRATVLQKPGKPKMAFGPFLQSLPFTVGEVVK